MYCITYTEHRNQYLEAPGATTPRGIRQGATIRIATLLALLVALNFLPRPVEAAQSFDGCRGFITSLPATISEQGVWCFDKDLSTSITVGAAITVSTNNVTIDCNDYKLGGLAGGISTSASGIYAAGRSNLTVRHCNIRGFHTAVYGNDTHGTLVENNLLEANTVRGLDIRGHDSVLRNNRINQTGGRPGSGISLGIYAQGSAIVEGNIISGVSGADDGVNTSVQGIYGGSLIQGNYERELVFDGGTFNGIQAVGAAIVRNNNVASAGAAPLGHGIRCTPNGGAVRDNVLLAFSTGLHNSCNNAGGNVVVP